MYINIMNLFLKSTRPNKEKMFTSKFSLGVISFYLCEIRYLSCDSIPYGVGVGHWHHNLLDLKFSESSKPW